jgi:hypothetical protein
VGLPVYPVRPRISQGRAIGDTIAVSKTTGFDDPGRAVRRLPQSRLKSRVRKEHPVHPLPPLTALAPADKEPLNILRSRDGAEPTCEQGKDCPLLALSSEFFSRDLKSALP